MSQNYPAARKNLHEIRDPIHVFDHFDSEERKVVNCRFLQRLRHVHQLSLSSLIYPGAVHNRFEHSLGVMELAGRTFDVITHPDAVTETVRAILPTLTRLDELRYWRRVLRMAALCHDIGHLPFSHTAEKELLPDGWDHERLTQTMILSPEMRKTWETMTPPLRAHDIAKLAVGPHTHADETFTNWEAILSEVIVGDAFGVDRMDYLLRDSHHAGVPYGRFDHYRLIDTLRILPSPPTEETSASTEPTLGVEQGGLQSAEALLWARYLMYSQVYFHPIRRIYDIHLRDFLTAWLPAGKFSTNLDDHVNMTDHEVWSALLQASADPELPGHDPARRIVTREHFQLFYQRQPDDAATNPEAGLAVCEHASNRFGAANVRRDSYRQRGGVPDFPVLTKIGTIVSAISMSEALRQMPVVTVDYVFIDPTLRDAALAWRDANRQTIIQPIGG